MSNPYLIGEAAVSALSESLLARSPSGHGKTFSVHVVEADEAERFLALKLTGDVFAEAFGDTPDELAIGYTKYFGKMLHVVVMDEERRCPAGALSFIRGQASELMTVVDIETQAWSQPIAVTVNELGLDDSSVCWDVATVAVPRAYARTPVMRALIHGMYMASRANGVTHWTAVLDDSKLVGLQRLVGGLFRPIGGRTSVPYFGSAASTAITGRVPTADDIESGRVRPREVVTNGFALENDVAFSPAVEAMRVAHATPARPALTAPTLNLASPSHDGLTTSAS